MKQFDMTEEDRYAVSIAADVARRLLRHRSITATQIIGLGKAIYILEKLPGVTVGASSEFGVSYCNGTDRFEETRYIEFRISADAFQISIGGSSYDQSIGSDTYSEPGWSFEISGYRDSSGNLASIQDSIEEYLNLGATITTNDESNIDIQDGA